MLNAGVKTKRVNARFERTGALSASLASPSPAMNGRRLLSRDPDAFPAGRRPHRTRASSASRSVPPEIWPEIARSPRRTRRRVTRGVDRPVTLAPPASRVRPSAHAPPASPHRGRRRGRVARRRRSGAGDEALPRTLRRFRDAFFGIFCTLRMHSRLLRYAVYLETITPRLLRASSVRIAPRAPSRTRHRRARAPPGRFFARD